MNCYLSGYPTRPEDYDYYLSQLKDGEPCFHIGCLNHVTQPCDGCGRIAGKPVNNEDSE